MVRIAGTLAVRQGRARRRLIVVRAVMVCIARTLTVGLFAVMPSAEAGAADGPRSEPLRLGSNRFRAGNAIEQLALAPHGTQLATVHRATQQHVALTVWDAETGQPLREQLILRELFRGMVWGARGGFAVVSCPDNEQKNTLARHRPFPHDFCVWNFTDRNTERPEALGQSNPAASRSRATWPRFYFSADGRCVAAWGASGDGRYAVEVYALSPAAHATQLHRLAILELGAEDVDEVRLSADGEIVVTFRELANPERSGSRDYTATVWQVRRGQPATRPFRLTTTDATPNSPLLELAPDGRAVFVLVHDGDQWGVDEVPLTTAPRRKVARWPNAQWPRDGRFAFACSGHRLALAVDRQTFLVNKETGEELGRLEGHAGRIVQVAIAAEGRRIATADEYGLIRLWDAKSLRPVHEVPHHRAPVEHAELSPDGRRLLTWSRDDTVRLWDIATGTELRALTPTPAQPQADCITNRPTFTPDGTAVVLRTAQRLIARDWQTGLEIPLPGELAHAPPHLAVFAPNGQAMLTWSDDKPRISVYDWPSGKKRFTIQPPGPPQPAQFSADSTVVFTGIGSGLRWDARTGQELPPGANAERPEALWPVVGLRSPLAGVLHTPRGQVPQLLEAGTGHPIPRGYIGGNSETWEPRARAGMAVSPCGQQFAAVVEREQLVVLGEWASGEARRWLRGHRGPVRILGFTPDGSKLLTAGGDHTVVVWDVLLTHAPLTEAFKKETRAAKLWDLLATGPAPEAYLAMARLAREPAAAVQMARRKLRPATTSDRETHTSTHTSILAEVRAIELLESLHTPEAMQLLRELAGGDKAAFRTQEAQRALQRLELTHPSPP
ncbi:MAG: hypothetical protein RMJ56_01810 [Gemmataceae bacterium]|nr:WD40 repeat domain-containing protein [Gemmata sp.]MDW8196319.1 hypothetical protein [Gemmataceae bacterium]